MALAIDRISILLDYTCFERFRRDQFNQESVDHAREGVHDKPVHLGQYRQRRG